MSTSAGDPRDLTSQQMGELRAYFNSSLFHFAWTFFGFKDLVASGPRPVHWEICQLLSQLGLKAEEPWHPGRRLMIQVPHGSYKCRAVGSLVHTPSGVAQIEKLTPGDLVYALDEQLRLVERHVTATRPGSAPLLRITLNNGITADVTPNHPFLTVGGWVEAMRLEVGSAIATSARLPCPTPSGEHPYTAGVLCGDGCASNYSLTCHDLEILEGLVSEGIHYAKRRTVRGCYGVPKRYWHPELLCGAWGKFIPADYEGSASFLPRLYDTDGSVGEGGVVLVTVSERLARDAQRNLLYFLVPSTIARYTSRGPNGYRSPAWRLGVGDALRRQACER